MSRLQLLGEADKAQAAAIMDESYDRLAESIGISFEDVDGAVANMAIMRICFEASDIVTRVAHAHGWQANREVHKGLHGITSFGAIGTASAPDDLIMDLTWAQFADSATKQDLGKRTDQEVWPGYFGRRDKVSNLFPLVWSAQKHGRYFSETSITYRQVTCSKEPVPSAPVHRYWLNTTPADPLQNFPVGAVPLDSFPRNAWQEYRQDEAPSGGAMGRVRMLGGRSMRSI